MLIGKKNIAKEGGQSTIEYLLLFFVIATVMAAFFRHPRIKAFFGPESEFFKAMTTRMEYSYRYGRPAPGPGRDSSLHDTFYDPVRGRSRFFAPADAYPRP